jgi:squalene-hopene/tetraprenyl-beta-curcumene cyclase
MRFQHFVDLGFRPGGRTIADRIGRAPLAMDQQLPKAKWRFAGIVALAFGFVLAGQADTALAQRSEAKRVVKPAKPAPSSPDEPIAAAASMDRAAQFLDEMAVSWTQERKCGSCHSNYPYLVARPSLKEASTPAMAEVRRFFEARVAHWNDDDAGAKPRWDAEVVATAAALALNDAATSGSLHPLTKQALDRIWTVQKPDGGFVWLKCDWPPLEYDDYYGAVVAALGVGHAPDNYAQSSAAEAGLEHLRAYFARTPSPNLHHQTMLLWASTRLDGLMSPDQRAATIDRLRALEHSDGGWSLPSLGTWKRRDGTPNDPGAPSDGYATGLVIYVLRQASVPASDPALKRGVSWLLSHQRISGRWFTRSLTNDKEHYISRAGSAYAVLALKSCEAE